MNCASQKKISIALKISVAWKEEKMREWRKYTIDDFHSFSMNDIEETDVRSISIEASIL